MFITRSRHNRGSMGGCRKKVVNDDGLGLTVTQTTKFDPRRMEARYRYWRRILADEMAQQYREAGYVDGLSGVGAINVTPGMFKLGKVPALANILNIASKIPVIGSFFCGIFGGCDRPSIPWGEIYATVEPIARQYAKAEEEARIAEEKYTTEVIRQTTGEQRSRDAAVFKMPEGVVGIRSNALIMTLKGKPVEKRI